MCMLQRMLLHYPSTSFAVVVEQFPVGADEKTVEPVPVRAEQNVVVGHRCSHEKVTGLQRRRCVRSEKPMCRRGRHP